MKNLFDRLKFVSKKKYDKLKEDCRSYRNNWESSDRVSKRCVEENHRLRDEVRKLHDMLSIERNKKSKPAIYKVEGAYSVGTPKDVISTIKEEAVKELLLGLSEFVHEYEYEEGMGQKRFRYSIALYPIDDKERLKLN